jgi:hypothetical protein
MRVMLAMLGARRRYIVPETMEELGVLARFVTDVYVRTNGWLQKVSARIGRWLKIRSLRSLAERSSLRIPIEQIVSFQWLGIRYAIAARCIRVSDSQLFASVNRQFCLKAIPYLRAIDVCWAYNGAAQELFEVARAKDIRCVLEQVSAPRDDERRELAQALQDWPEWGSSEDLTKPITSDPLSGREQAEWRLANMIVVGSHFVKGCLQRAGVPTSRCMIVPSGIDLERFKVGTEVRSNGPLRVLFVGQTNLQKGTPYLLEAVRRLNSSQVQLKLIGSIRIEQKYLSAFLPWASFTNSVPPSEIMTHYQWADVLVVPSVCEGSAMVTYEGRGCGVPIIATPNAGAFFSPGVDGLEIPVRDVDAIIQVLDRLARNRDEVRNLREGAIANRCSLGRQAYRERIRNALKAVMDQSLHAPKVTI